MKIIRLGNNVTEFHSGDWIILFSYQTPVAAHNNKEGGFFRTEMHHSMTTSKHINKWLAGAVAKSKPQEFFDSLKDSL